MSLESFLGVVRRRPDRGTEIESKLDASEAAGRESDGEAAWGAVVRSLAKTYVDPRTKVYMASALKVDPANWTDDGIRLPHDYPRFVCTSTSYERLKSRTSESIWEIEFMARVTLLDLRSVFPYFVRAYKANQLQAIPVVSQTAGDAEAYSRDEAAMGSRSTTSGTQREYEDEEEQEDPGNADERLAVRQAAEVHDLFDDYDPVVESALVDWIGKWVWPYWEDRYEGWKLTLDEGVSLIGLTSSTLIECCSLFHQSEYFLDGPPPQSETSPQLEPLGWSTRTKNILRVTDWDKQRGRAQRDIVDMIRKLGLLEVSSRGKTPQSGAGLDDEASVE